MSSEPIATLPLEELLKRAAAETDTQKLYELVREISTRYQEQEDRQQAVSNKFAIFRGVPGRETELVETVEGLGPAHERMHQVAAEQPGAYFLFHNSTGTVATRLDYTPAKVSSNEEPPESGIA